MSNPKKQAVGYTAGAPYAKAVIYGDLVFVSGAVGRNPATGEMAKGDITAQTKQTLENVRSTLQAAGSDMDKVVKATVFITDMSLFKTLNATYITFFPGEAPARSCVQVGALPDPDALVEIEVVAGR
ncbi:MAG: hypothetical protein GX605_00890 [Chloroflexi bacterium]|nr:hypothetical protein [Chloroflexota bacterium]